MYCSKCGTANDDTSRFCAKCGTPLGGAPATGSTTAPPPVDPRIRGGATLPVPPQPGPSPGAVTPSAKNPWIAVLLSLLIPGVGQFYNNDPKKGGLMLGVAIVLSWTIIAYLGMWVWSMIDAHQVASGKGRPW